MSTLYDTTILLSLGLATVLGAVFAIATTFLGRSLQQARESETREKLEADLEARATIIEIEETVRRESSREAI